MAITLRPMQLVYNTVWVDYNNTEQLLLLLNRIIHYTEHFEPITVRLDFETYAHAFATISFQNDYYAKECFDYIQANS